MNILKYKLLDILFKILFRYVTPIFYRINKFSYKVFESIEAKRTKFWHNVLTSEERKHIIEARKKK